MNLYMHRETGKVYFSELAFSKTVLNLSSKLYMGDLDYLFMDFRLNLEEDKEKIEKEFKKLELKDVNLYLQKSKDSQLELYTFEELRDYHFKNKYSKYVVTVKLK